MQLNNHSAIVDNDFLSHLAETCIPEDQKIAAVRTVFEELYLEAVMHPLVYEHEKPKNSPAIDRFFQERVVTTFDFTDIFWGELACEKQQYYEKLIKDFYHELNAEIFPDSVTDVLSYWRRLKSLGEIHAFATCLTCGCGIILSDDGDAIKLQRHIQEKSMGKIPVYKREDLFEMHRQEGKTLIKRQIRRALEHKRS